MSNPIFIEYYSHEQCDCYKVLNPWTNYAKETIVLCKVEEGINKANKLCREIMNRELISALNEPIL